MPLFRFEPHGQGPAPTAVFVRRVAVNLLVAAAIIAVALGIGMIGYRVTEGMSWLDAFVNAAMLLGGMGPVDPLHTAAGKLFAGLYALMCGLLIIFITGVVLAPVLHRVMHALRVPDEDAPTSDS